MKTIFKWLFRLLILLIVLVVAGILLMDTLVKQLVESQIKQQIGLDVQVGKAEVGLLRPKFRLENISIYNPPDFGGGKMVEIPELHLEYDLNAMLYRKVHLNLFRLDIAKVEVVQNQAGKLNVTLLEEKLRAQTGNPNAGFAKADNNSFGMDFGGIDTFVFSIGKFKFTSLRSPADSQEFDLGIKRHVLKNLYTEQQFADALTTLLFQKALPAMMRSFGEPPAPVVKPKAAPPRQPAKR